MLRTKLLIVLVIALAFGQEAFSQDYKTGVGMRISPFYGVTVKHFVSESRAIEGILQTRSGGFGLTGLYEAHTTAFKVPRLKAFGGIGGHINAYRNDDKNGWGWGRDGVAFCGFGHEPDDKDERNDDDDRSSESRDHSIAFGMDLILGMEYTFKELPFNLGVDWKPAINLIGDQGASLSQLAISARFVF